METIKKEKKADLGLGEKLKIVIAIFCISALCYILALLIFGCIAYWIREGYMNTVYIVSFMIVVCTTLVVSHILIELETTD